MKANELRIGNKILMEFENSIEVVNSRTIGFIAVSNRTEKPHPFVGIPLSEEILLKCGFTIGMLECVFHAPKEYWHVYISAKEGDSDEKFTFRGLGASIVDIKYLHQLQNLYFALTGEELKVSQLI